MEANRRKAKNTNHRNVITKRHPELRDNFDAQDFESGTSANSITPASAKNHSADIIQQKKQKSKSKLSGEVKNNLCCK